MSSNNNAFLTIQTGSRFLFFRILRKRTPLCYSPTNLQSRHPCPNSSLVVFVPSCLEAMKPPFPALRSKNPFPSPRRFLVSGMAVHLPNFVVQGFFLVDHVRWRQSQEVVVIHL